MKYLPPRETPPLPDESWHEEETPIGEILGRAFGAIRRNLYFPIIFLIAGVGLAFLALQFITPKYSSSVSIRIERRSPLRDSSDMDYSRYGDRGYLQGEVMWFTYRPVIEEMLSRVGLVEALRSPQDQQELIREFQEKRIQVEPFRGANVLKVTSSWNTARKAREIVSTLADVFIERYEKYNQDELDRQTLFLSRQVKDLKARIEEKEAGLSEFQKTTRLLSTEEGLKSLNESLTTLEIELGKAEFELKNLIYNKELLKTQIDNLGQSAPVGPVLVSHLLTPASPLYDKMVQAEALEKSIQLLKQEEEQTEGQTGFGSASPVNESLRVSLVQPSPLRRQLEDVMALEKELHTLQLRYMPKHDSVILATEKLDDASRTARSMIVSLDRAGGSLFDQWGPSILLSKAATWAPGLGVERQKLPRMEEKLKTLSQDIRQMIRQFDPAGVPIFDTFGAGYMLAQAVTWQGMGKHTTEQGERLKDNLRTLEFNEESLNNRIAGLREEIRKTQQRFDDLPASQAILEGKVREIKVLEDLYVMLEQRLSTAMIEARANMWQVEIVDPPAEPTDPDFPKPALFLAGGLILGLLLGCGIPILVELLADRILSPEDVERQLGIPVLAKLPELGSHNAPALGWTERLKSIGYKKGTS